MLGWEFPPYFAGGVGTVCYGLTRSLARKGIEVTYIMPRGPDQVRGEHVRLITAADAMQHVRMMPVRSLLTAYTTGAAYAASAALQGGAIYGKDLLDEMGRFAAVVADLVRDEAFDIIHAHDWTTIPAALALKRATGKPLVLHVHITEFDKTGGTHADPDVYRIEHEGLHGADRIVAVSNLVKERLVRQYHVDPRKVRVVYNTIDSGAPSPAASERISGSDRIVLFLGRVTLQKGPDYFLEAAAKVAAALPDVKFVIAGTGDMLPRIVERAAQLGLGSRVVFSGFVSREEGDRLYRMADLFVMPSVSEPFGIVPLEAIRQGTPVIVSRQSGVSEVLKNALKVDFWDTEDLAAKIIAALTYRDLHQELRSRSAMEISGYSWDAPAQQCIDLYHELDTRAAPW